MFELPPNLICIRDPLKAYYIVRPKSYQELLAKATALFTDNFDSSESEIYFTIDDTNLDEDASQEVEILSEVWDASNGLAFAKYLKVDYREIGSGPSEFKGPLATGAADPRLQSSLAGRSYNTQATDRSDSTNRTIVGTAGIHLNTWGPPHSRSQPTAGPSSAQDREFSDDVEEIFPANKDGQQSPVQSKSNSIPEPSKPRMSREGNSKTSGRLVKINRASIRTTEIPQSQESQQEEGVIQEIPETILITIQYGELEGTFKAKYNHPVSKVIDRACRHFRVDADIAKLLHVVSLDDSDSVETFPCSREDTLRSLGAHDGDMFLLHADSDDSDVEEIS